MQERGVNAVCTGNDDLLSIFIETNDNTKGTDDKNIKKSLLAFCGIQPTSIRVVYLTDFPRNEYGKISYKSLDNFH